MPQVKTTPRKPGLVCPLCCERLPSDEEWKAHLVICGTNAREKKKFECNECNFVTEKNVCLKRHKERKHPVREDSLDEHDPGNVLDILGEISEDDPEPASKTSKMEEMITVRKPCRPNPVYTPKRPNIPQDSARVSSIAVKSVTGSVREPGLQTRDTGTQLGNVKTFVDAAVQVNFSNHRRTIKTTTSYTENGKSVVKVEEEEWFD
ncbi:uncharacterized protein LOC110467372 [Mizuhopecten yessoensis]|uniref:uncharacterized protein LOC110447638 n=1 Tax=Mizuhopecten yessoensis TaxID=6573 RepID=UPI000B4572D8|nr:uncharacterized protein LOC110447638 [Mizuhopecten yessoensis]XP_021356832.1 uncharacterized protein LOC110452549 [Mizuhopecten yessoensis]XP_021358740.1 uncharacterized protein LOC110453875 [Mizuhopecten yessoensis]XP_021362567.1 uncharacterized protein LOC110456273 [Mizuhopecten yessoensis]XP_021366229.1 uncharacterized protein LOC110458692 [Mizuhopecten yessoensis]XP_021367754.1 uncharacterized protein LOC110459704 [Mizuhopecten yessoensis]XP_021371745.1 uncharacterized protein LOC11046